MSAEWTAPGELPANPREWPEDARHLLTERIAIALDDNPARTLNPHNPWDAEIFAGAVERVRRIWRQEHE